MLYTLVCSGYMKNLAGVPRGHIKPITPWGCCGGRRTTDSIAFCSTPMRRSQRTQWLEANISTQD